MKSEPQWWRGVAQARVISSTPLIQETHISTTASLGTLGHKHQVE